MERLWKTDVKSSVKRLVPWKRISSDQVHLLRARIGHYVNHFIGRTDASHRYLKEAPAPAFVDVKPEEFTNWLSVSQRRASDQFNRAEKDLATLLNGGSQLFGTGNAVHAFPVTPDVSPPGEDYENSTERPHKRPRIAEKDKPPCLRCRILKKKVSYSRCPLYSLISPRDLWLSIPRDLVPSHVRDFWLTMAQCDSLEQCSHCPTQSFDNENDFWKILGCFRSRLQDLSLIFCPGRALTPRLTPALITDLFPAFARSTTRTFRYRNGGREVVNFVLAKSRVSDQKRRRMMYLVEARPDFAQLDDASWDDITTRESMSEAAMTSTEYGGDGYTFTGGDGGTLTPEGFLQQDYEAAWSVLQAVSMDPTYLMKTEYNLFTLLRQGNEFSVYEPVSAS